VFMSWQGVYRTSKKIHKISMWGVATLGTVQLATGTLMIWPKLFGIGRLMQDIILDLHIMIAPYTALCLLVQIVTGLLMWLSPKLMARKV